ncbi:MAG: hypothetical protein DME26_05625 [Verrucomicrobia bacterium]|nr:MAG: hypothetical protein DME26_05625 [Verrucomicrobiota bacterium]
MLYNDRGTVIITGGIFTNNLSVAPASLTGQFPPGAGRGGAVYQEGGSLAITGSTYLANSAMGSNAFFCNYTCSSPTPAFGGVLYVASGELTIDNARFISNTARGAIGFGGAIYSGGMTSIRNSTFASNQALTSGVQAEGRGGALYVTTLMSIGACAFADNAAVGGPGSNAIYSTGILSVANSVLDHNRAIGGTGGASLLRAPQRGGDGNGGGFWATGPLTLIHCTLSANSAIGGAGGRFGDTAPDGASNGGGIYSGGSSTLVRNTIIANSLSGSNCFGVITDGGGNISSDGSCNFSAPGSLNNTDPLLGPLGDYGGPTPTLPLLAGSPAIDRAISTFCTGTDQRGVVRPIGAGCDIGAFESGTGFSIRGQVRGWGIGAGILVESSTSFTVTDANGNYFFNGLPAGTYAVLPFIPGFIFVPELQVVTVGPDTVGIDFKGYRVNYLSVEPSSNAVQRYVYAGTNGQLHEVQLSTNLIDWQTMATNAVDARNIFEFFVTNSANDRIRFFRTKKQQ